jgi:hypothetical protein
MRSDSASSDQHFSEQLSKLNGSVNAEATSAAATTKLADAATKEAGEAERAATASLNNANAAISLARTSASALTVASKAATSTQQLADSTSRSVTQFAKSMAINETNFTRDERPWIWTRAREDRSKADKGKIIIIVDMGNSGKSPAVRAIIQSWAWYALNPDIMSATFNRNFVHVDAWPVEKIGVVPPSGGAIQWWTKANNFTMLPSQLAASTNLDRAFATAGRIGYQDLAGHQYHTDFCYYRLATAGYEPCEQYNEMK